MLDIQCPVCRGLLMPDEPIAWCLQCGAFMFHETHIERLGKHFGVKWG